MKLVSGMEVEVIGETLVENKKHLMCKLASAKYVGGTLVRFVLLAPNEFVDYNDAITKNVGLVK